MTSPTEINYIDNEMWLDMNPVFLCAEQDQTEQKTLYFIKKKI